MKVRPGCAQNIGARNEQQDSFGFSHIEDAALVKRAGILAVVADGMGGLAMGRESGDLAVKATLAVHASSLDAQDPVTVLQDAVEAANRDVLSMAVNAGVAGEAGSTLVAVIVKDEKLYWTSVGDSRIYLYRSGELVQANTEQNFAADLMRRVADGTLSRDEALNNPDGAGLTNYIGNPDLLPADGSLRPFPIQNGDWLLLCSDGLFGTLDDDEIREELFGNPNDACERLIKKVTTINKPHQDNVTVAILGFGDKDPVTVKTRKFERVQVFQPLPVEEKCRKPLLWVLVAVLVIVAGAGAFWFLRGTEKVEPVAPDKPAFNTQSGVKREQDDQTEKPAKPVPPKKKKVPKDQVTTI